MKEEKTHQSNYWTYEKCKEEALKFKNKTDFTKKSKGAYQSSKRNNWYNDMTEHMEKTIRKTKNINDEYNVDHFQFINIKKPEVSYILGLLWADGCISKKGHRISLDCKYEDVSDSDFNIFNDILNKTGEWDIYIRDRYDKRTNKTYHSSTFSTSNKFLNSFLMSMDYDKKSYIPPIKILNIIPTDLKHHFIRGYIDGDGCFFYKKHTAVLDISSTYDYDWDFMFNICNELSVEKCSVSKRLSNKSKSSSFIITNKWDIVKIGEWIYENSENMRLERKYNKYINIKETNTKRLYKRDWSLDEEDFLIKNYKNDNIKECAEKLSRTPYSISCKVQSLGISNTIIWEKQDVNFLIENYHNGLKYCVSKLNKNEQVVLHKARKLKLTSPNEKWTDDDKNYLINNYHKGVEHCSKILNRTTISIYSYAHIIGLTKKLNTKKWTDDEILFLKLNKGKGLKFVSVKLNRTLKSVQMKSIRLKLH